MASERVALLGPASPLDLASLLTGSDADRAMSIRGYRGVPTSNLAYALVGEGVQVDVITTAPEISEPLVLEGGRLRMLIAPQRRRARARALDLFARERAAVEALLRQSDAQVLHAHWTYEFAWAAQADGRPLVVTAHDAPLTILREMRDGYRAVRTVMAYIARTRIRRLTAVSPYLAARWRREMLYREPIVVIPNVVSQHRVGHSRTAETLVDVTDSGRRKNLWPLLEAHAMLLAEGRDLKLELIGPGLGSDGEIAQGARRRRLAVSVCFLGELDREGVDAALRRAAVFVHPSREESFGLSVAEAMAVGVPVVAGTSAGALPWVVGETGILVDVEEPAEIAEAVGRVLDEPALAAALGARARSRAATLFAPHVVASAYLDVYSEARNDRKRQAR